MPNEEKQGRTDKREQGRENEQKQVSDNVVSSVDANTFTLWQKMNQLSPAHNKVWSGRRSFLQVGLAIGKETNISWKVMRRSLRRRMFQVGRRMMNRLGLTLFGEIGCGKDIIR